MELIWLEDFVALAAVGNFSRAAEERHVTQPAFSRRVRALEDWVGAQLFVRGAHGVTLTAAGEHFRTGAHELIRRMNQLQHECREAGGKEASSLRFAATHALSFTFFPQWMRHVETRAPLGAIQLISDSMQACEALLLHGRAQFLLCHHHPAAPVRFGDGMPFDSTTVGRDSLFPVVTPDAQGEPKWRLSADAKDLPLLAYSEESGLGRIVAAQHFAGRLPGLHPVFSARLAATLMTLARDGRGIAWLPASLAENDVAAGRLVRAGDPEWEIEVEIRVFRPSGTQSAAAETFWTHVIAGG
jgi:LysR family transcriptional regulator, hypochlorite-specific transcription factor HypT